MTTTDEWEYRTVEGPRKGPEPYNLEDGGWERDYSQGRPGEAWDRFDHHEEYYWKRRIGHTKPRSFQERVRAWIMACFGPMISDDKIERGDRLLEEVLELLQSGDYPMERAAALIPYVYGRTKGEPVQELGGVMVCLAAYCHPHDLDMDQAGETELARIWTKMDKIRSKHDGKPTGAALLPERTPDGYRWKYEGEGSWTYQATAPKSFPDVIIEALYIC